MTARRTTCESRRAVWARVWICAVLGVLVWAAACSSGEPLPNVGGGATGHDPTVGAPCTSGTTEPCYETVGNHGGVLTCYKGQAACVNGSWSSCGGGDLFQTAALPANAGGVRALSFSSAQACRDNPCNPYCRQFTEVPEGGGLGPNYIDASLVPDAGPNGFAWKTGSSFGYPPALLGGGLNQPCSVRADCQFDMHCVGPSSGSCAHGLCVVGSSLTSGCDSCATEICAADPSCCQTTSASTCAHDPCVEGGALAASPTPCDPCVATVCAQKPSCCTTLWDSSCIALVGTSCAPRTCHCASGQVSNGNECYEYVSTMENWASARANCQSLGAGLEGGVRTAWDLATISSAAENTFARKLTTDVTWIGHNDIQVEGKWMWPDGTTQFWSGNFTGHSVGGLYNNWSAGSPDNARNNEDCGEILFNTNGTWNDDDCVTPNASLCEGPPTTLSASPPNPVAWSQRCVQDVPDVCGSTCTNDDPPNTDGTCTPWFPEQTDPSCPTGVDLGIGFTCNDGTNDLIPICNHGGAAVPAGTALTLLGFPSGSNQFGQTNPTGATTTCSVTLASTLQAGFCVDVPGSTCPGITPGTEIMVNPNTSSAIAECHYDDNWSVFYNGSCQTPTCSGNSSRSDLKAVHLMVVLDESGSMGPSSGTPTRWQQATDALRAFFSDPNSAGLYVALRFFPDPSDGCGEPSSGGCNSQACVTPSVDEAALTADFAPTDAQEQKLLSALSAHNPTGGTPTASALQGAYEWAAQQETKFPGDAYVVVLVTDGEPQGCDPTQNSISGITALAQEAYADSIRTYTIGIEDVSVGDLDQIAAAGVGGPSNCVPSLAPHCSFFVCATQTCGTGPAADGGTTAVPFTEQLVQAMEQIAGKAASCSFDLPNANNIDPTTAVVDFVQGTDPAAAIGPYCSGNGKQFGDSCYLYSQVRETSWTAAQTDCQAFGAGWDLVAIDSPGENTYVSGLRSSAPAWIGYNDRTTEGSFVWSNGQCDAFENWSAGQPDNAGPGGEDCAEMNLGGSGRWSDVTCTEPNFLAMGALCEGPLLQPQGRCGVGQFEGPGSTCFQLVTAPLDYADAGAACQSTPGWTLASLTASNIDFANGLVKCSKALVGSTYSPTGLACPVLQDNGTFVSDCTTPTPYLCTGPFPTTGPPAPPPGTSLTQVSNTDANGDGIPDACTGNDQWYFNDPATPSTATLCPATCDRVKVTRGSQVSVSVACKPPSQISYGGTVEGRVPVQTSRQETYVSTCTSEERTQWDFMAYDATTPADSRVVFSARTADNTADLATAAFVPLAIADTADGTSHCPLVPPTGTCPVSVFDKLGNPAQYQPVLQLDIELTPGKGNEAPIANNWYLSFSCVPGQ